MVAGEHDIRPTCLSDSEHNGAIQNHVLHYLGCIEISQREKFYETNIALWRKDVDVEFRRIMRESKDGQENEVLKTAESNVTERLQKACETELHRIDYLRALLTNDEEAHQLVWDLEISRARWRSSKEYKSGLQDVKKWREQHATAVAEKANPAAEGDPSEGGIQGGSDNQPKQGETVDIYEPEKDFNLHIIEFEDVEHQEDGEEESKSVPTKRQVPDRKVKIHEILEKNVPPDDLTNNALYGCNKSGKLSYIHLPANNMFWVEEAIARYYGEKRSSYDGIYRELQESERTKTYMILRPQFWRGQQHGGRSAPPHARHMRPLCNIVSSNPETADPAPKNIVLFMPYLHWETDRQRENFAANIEKITEDWREKKKKEKKENKEERQRHREGLPRIRFQTPKEEKSSFWSKAWAAFVSMTSPDQLSTQMAIDADQNSSPYPQLPMETSKVAGNSTNYVERKVEIITTHDDQSSRPSNHKVKGSFKFWHKETRRRPGAHHIHSRVPGGKIRSFPTLVKAMVERDRKGLPVEKGRVITRSKLGQFIIDSARLYEEMSNYRDKKLFQKYLHNDPPLHPRRTLDQAYYWTLDKTSARDRDQVVYRSTKPRIFHKYDHETEQWPEHKDQELHPDQDCNECHANIRKVSRLVMVDQLWMWILDEETIITCFPKRYGTNKQENDSSSVHKSIRMKLQSARQNHIRSVFDLALIIIDECSNAFFDRTKTRDRQPQVLDAFSEAIGNVTNKQTAAFERLYRWTSSASNIYRAKAKVDPELIKELHIPLLDIYPEGILQKEIKDVIEELDILIDINRTEQQVLSDFILRVEHILDPEGIYRHQNRRWKNHMGPNDIGHVSSGNGKSISEQDLGDGSNNKYDWFKVNADEILAKVHKRIEELEVLKRKAQSTSSSLTDLLGLKQQQASVVEAWQSVKQSEEAVSQGRSIMMFTVVTIFFLPLSFMASVFGMNAQDFGQGTVSIFHELKYMLAISFAIIIPTFILAFSTWIRALIWFIYKYTVTITLVKTGLYGGWLNLGLPSRKLFDHANAETEKLKNIVREAKGKQRREKRQKEDEEWKNQNTLSLSSSNDIRSHLTATATSNTNTRKPWRLWRHRDRDFLEVAEEGNL